MKRHRILVLGTDTGVGKTWVTCALARTLRQHGHAVVGIKPVETGCSAETLPTEDGVLIANATGQTEPRVALRRFEPPLAPILAGGEDEATLQLDALLTEITRYETSADVLLLEGVGGLLSPVTWTWNMTHLARTLDCRVVLVGLDRLGIVNHVLLAMRELERCCLELAAIVLNAPVEPDASTGRNAYAIQKSTGYSQVVGMPRNQRDFLIGMHTLGLDTPEQSQRISRPHLRPITS